VRELLNVLLIGQVYYYQYCFLAVTSRRREVFGPSGAIRNTTCVVARAPEIPTFL
jgi:hypothetical protein